MQNAPPLSMSTEAGRAYLLGRLEKNRLVEPIGHARAKDVENVQHSATTISATAAGTRAIQGADWDELIIDRHSESGYVAVHRSIGTFAEMDADIEHSVPPQA
jgi:hypothetical protein